VLDYMITPNAVPRTVSPAEPSVVTLMITVTNKTGAEVPVQRLTFTIQAGDGPANLTDADHLADIKPAAGSGTQWDFFRGGDGDGRFFAYPNPPHTGLAAGQSVAFVLSQVTVNQAIGHAEIGVRESDAASLGETVLTIAKQEPGLAITELLASPVQITPGQTSALVWRTTGASTCTMTTERGTQPVDRRGSMHVSPQETTVYTLSAEGDGRTKIQQVIVTVATVKIHSFSANPRNLAQGDETTFAWETTGAASCTLDPGGIALEPPAAGKLTLPVEESAFYTLTATGFGREMPLSRSVTVMPVELTRFGAAPQMAPAGGEVTLSWDAKWASGFYLDPPGQALDRRTSSLTVRPARTTTYKLAARGLQGRSAEVTVSAGPAIAAIGLTTSPDDPRVMVVAWEVVHAGTDVTVQLDGMSPSPPQQVSASGNRILPVPCTFLLTVGRGGDTTTATLVVPGPLVVYIPQVAGPLMLKSLQLTGPAGIGAEGSTVTTSWQAQGLVRGQIRDEHSSRELKNPSGQAELRLGQRVAGRPLWQGDIFASLPVPVPPPHEQAHPEVGMRWTITQGSR
jgi:hypothetical protein